MHNFLALPQSLITLQEPEPSCQSSRTHIVHQILQTASISRFCRVVLQLRHRLIRLQHAKPIKAVLHNVLGDDIQLDKPIVLKPLLRHEPTRLGILHLEIIRDHQWDVVSVLEALGVVVSRFCGEEAHPVFARDKGLENLALPVRLASFLRRRLFRGNVL